MHKQLEAHLSQWLALEDTILYPSCFDANGGLFEVLLGAEDAVISDELNHASIIDGVRLCKAQRYRYKNNDMADLEAQLKAADAAGARFKLISTDGVFSMDGVIARSIRFAIWPSATTRWFMSMTSHSTGIVGPQWSRHGRISQLHRAHRRSDVDAWARPWAARAAASPAARSAIVELLRQRSRPYLFSNTVPPPLSRRRKKAVEIAATGDDLRKQLKSTTWSSSAMG